MTSYNMNKLVSRGWEESEERQVAAMPVTTTGSFSSPVVQQEGAGNRARMATGKAGGPRIPTKRRYISSYSATALYPSSSSSSSGNGLGSSSLSQSQPAMAFTSYHAKTTEAPKPETHDSGLGLEGEEMKRRRQAAAVSSRYVARCSAESEEEDVVEPDSSAVHPGAITRPNRAKSSDSFTRNVATDSITVDEETRPRYPVYDREMDLAPSPKFDARQYQEHLFQLQQRAIEQDRLQEGLCLLLPNEDGDTGLHQAVIHSQPNMVSRLLALISKYPQLRSSIDDQNSLFQTPLHLALHLQQTDVVSQLLQSGASILLQDHKGNTPLHIACSQSNSKCLQEILNSISPADLMRASQVRNYEGLTCLHSAVLSKNQDALLRLMKAGVYIDLQDHHSGKTPLHLAVEQGSFQIIQTLVRSCNSNIDSVTFSGCTPLHFAAGHDRLDIVAYLVSLGADPFILTDEGDTAWDLASEESVRDFLGSVTDMYCD